LVAELRLDSARHLRYFRMDAAKMEELLSIVGADITTMTTNFREAISPQQRLAVTLRFLASGESFSSLAYQFRMGKTTVAESVRMTCQAIQNTMMAEQFPRLTEQRWRDTAGRFGRKWNFPNCIGAIDGKHITTTAPSHSGSLFFNYKKTFSIVLLALVDADYRFMSVQVGDFGRSSDGGTYANSELGRGMEAKTLSVPADSPLPGSGHLGPLPFTMVGNVAFPLKPYLMQPFPGQRLSWARMVVESAFGILAARWRVFYTRINLKPETVDSVVLAACILHNFLCNPSDNQRWLRDAEDRREHLADARNMGGNHGRREAYEVREKFSAFFNSAEGSVPWQNRMV
uniref:DDE Tnp4 domain-containing protein n=1 Tax=Salarias fasciatus TaxID=181472 RepID=A0A672ILS6_SALFA